MKRIPALLVLMGMVTISALAQNPNITGVYSGQTSCLTTNEPISIRIVHLPDNSLAITLVTGSTGWYAKNSSTTLQSSFQALTENIRLSSPELRHPLSLNVSNYKKQVSLELVGRCEPFYLRRNDDESKQLKADLKRNNDESKSAQSSGLNVELSLLFGSWVMHNQRDLFQVIADKDGIYLRKLGAGGYVVRLEPSKRDAKSDPSQAYIFGPAGNALQKVNFIKVAIQPDQRDASLSMRFRDLTGQWTSGLTLYRAAEPTEETRLFDSKSFIYSDWQKRKYDGYYLVDDEEAVRRLKKAIDSLYVDGGWRCLAQTSFTATPTEENSRIFGEQGADRMYLIYSPYGGGLVYATPGLGRLYPTQYDYPIFITSHPTLFESNAWFGFQVIPPANAATVSSSQIPITIFHFGRAPGDYGTGCAYTAEKERADNFRNRVLAKLVIVFALEYGRRVSAESKSEIPEFASTVARNEFIKSLMHDLMPEKSDDELNYLVRWIGLVMSGDFRPQSYVRESIREAIIQRVSKEKPQYALDLRILDLLIDLTTERRRW